MSNQNIVVRATRAEDFEAIAAINSRPRAVWGTLQIPFTPVDVWRKRLSERPDGLHALSACLGDEVVGSLGLLVAARSPRRRHAAELGMSVHDEQQGRGVGTALLAAAIDLAERWLNLSRLELTVYVDNAPALGLYKKFEFKIEGTLAKYAFRDGEFVDAYAMARVR
jgi:putative acetyltransferase